TIDHDDVFEIRDYAFSPDGKWVAYTKNAETGMNEVWLYNVAEGTKSTISGGFTADFNPRFDPTGKYLYFLSQRFVNPILGEFDREFLVTKSTKVCMALLAKDTKSPFLPDELLDNDKAKDKDKKDD